MEAIHLRSTAFLRMKEWSYVQVVSYLVSAICSMFLFFLFTNICVMNILFISYTVY